MGLRCPHLSGIHDGTERCHPQPTQFCQAAALVPRPQHGLLKCIPDGMCLHPTTPHSKSSNRHAPHALFADKGQKLAQQKNSTHLGRQRVIYLSWAREQQHRRRLRVAQAHAHAQPLPAAVILLQLLQA